MFVELWLGFVFGLAFEFVGLIGYLGLLGFVFGVGNLGFVVR